MNKKLVGKPLKRRIDWRTHHCRWHYIKNLWLDKLVWWFFEEIWSLFIIVNHYKKLQQILTERVIQLERNAVTNAQYHQWELVEVNPVPPSISDKELEVNICQALSLTGYEVKPDDLQTCDRLKKKESVIVKFKCRKLKQKTLVNWKNLQNLKLYTS